MVFYPNGNRAAESGNCTVMLTRGVTNDGIKFELILNGKGSGPKACFSRRFVGDFSKPYEPEEDGRVRIRMSILEIVSS